MQKAKSPKRGPGKAAKRKAALSAQQTIPYLVMHPDGVCQLPGGLYTKTVEYEDINYGDELPDYNEPDGYGDEDDDGPPWDEEDDDGEEADK